MDPVSLDDQAPKVEFSVVGTCRSLSDAVTGAFPSAVFLKLRLLGPSEVSPYRLIRLLFLSLRGFWEGCKVNGSIIRRAEVGRSFLLWVVGAISADGSRCAMGFDWMTWCALGLAGRPNRIS